MDKRFLAILAALVVIFGGIFIFSQNSSNKSSTSSAQPSNHVIGDGAKSVTLIEYGDFQCSACKAYETVLKQVRTAYAKDIYFQFRNLPLVSIHPNAFPAARAAEAASLQDKFWEMHDTLYENQDSTGQAGWVASKNALDDYYVKFAQQIGLNLTQFRQDYASSKANGAINADLAAFGKTGKQMSTPTFFLNGTYLDTSKLTDQNNRPLFEKFKAVLDAEITKQQPKQ